MALVVQQAMNAHPADLSRVLGAALLIAGAY
jgi:hypothetical protein